MAEQQLDKLLRRLHDELEHAERLDTDTQLELAELRSEIQQFLGEEENEGLSDKLTERLRDLTYKLEESHPRLTGIMRHVMTTLSNMGI